MISLKSGEVSCVSPACWLSWTESDRPEYIGACQSHIDTLSPEQTSHRSRSRLVSASPEFLSDDLLTDRTAPLKSELNDWRPQFRYSKYQDKPNFRGFLPEEPPCLNSLAGLTCCCLLGLDMPGSALLRVKIFSHFYLKLLAVI